MGVGFNRSNEKWWHGSWLGFRINPGNFLPLFLNPMDHSGLSRSLNVWYPSPVRFWEKSQLCGRDFGGWNRVRSLPFLLKHRYNLFAMPLMRMNPPSMEIIVRLENSLFLDPLAFTPLEPGLVIWTNFCEQKFHKTALFSKLCSPFNLSAILSILKSGKPWESFTKHNSKMSSSNNDLHIELNDWTLFLILWAATNAGFPSWPC